MLADALEGKNIKYRLTASLNYHKTLLGCLKFIRLEDSKTHLGNGMINTQRNPCSTLRSFLLWVAPL